MIRVAVVDDHVVVRMGLRHLIASSPDLEFCGEFGGGKGAVDFVSSVQPDVTLMDVRMPVMDGLTATQMIRGMDRADAKTVPIIAMTANVFDEDVERSLKAGMDAHLSKPIEPEKMYETMAQLISKRSMAELES
jgi:CheY-like chemotaxis protein